MARDDSPRAAERGSLGAPLLARRGARPWTGRMVVVAPSIFVLTVAAAPLLGVHVLPLASAPGPYDPDDLAAALVHVAPYAQGGRVDYAALADDDGSLQRFVATSAVVGPTATPEDFRDRDARLAFALNAYNANVLAAVIAHAPLGSVRDVRGPLEPTPGFGFFWALKVRIDGRQTNLYDYEHDVVRAFGDARIHAALNCASTGCPPLATRPFEAASLDAQLDQAMRRMLTLPRNLRVENDAIRLSAIFDWFREDFVAHAQRLGRRRVEGRDEDEGWLLAFLLAFVDGEAEKALDRAARRGLPIAYEDYDWSLNGTR